MIQALSGRDYQARSGSGNLRRPTDGLLVYTIVGLSILLTDRSNLPSSSQLVTEYPNSGRRASPYQSPRLERDASASRSLSARPSRGLHKVAWYC
ncbi:hypothetical protein BDM02DRAFT_3109694 [Thelephora ganbajun]|uniref:Uncharacterized protein n=1 Tax=Thelephora ganbajun TaxID=370292 RepID=A0ACB6ZR82_THEGA|nr:hypothetical protein BDM02DRAFT_3109694 [Thelephora ganbajun]